MPSKSHESQIKAMNAISGILLLALLLGVGGVLWKAMSTFEAVTVHNTKMLELAHNATSKLNETEAELRELKVRVVALEIISRPAKKH